MIEPFTHGAAQRVLLVRLSAIGDVLHGLPVLNALRAAWPQAFIAWVVEARAAALLAGHPALDTVVEIPRGWLKQPGSVLAVRRRLSALRCNLAIDLQGLSKSALAARLSGARTRIGFAGHDGRELSRWLNNVRIQPTAAHVIDRNLELLRPLGIGGLPAGAADCFRLPERAQDASTALDILYAGQLLPRFVLINPGAGWPSKLWPPGCFAAVARHLGRRGLPSLVVWGGAKEHDLAAEVVRAAEGSAHLAPETSLCELAALARRAAIFVSADTGPLHVAAAVGTPCVGLFGPMPAQRNGPYGPQHISVQKACLSDNSRSRRTADNASMLAISVDDVTAACDTLLNRQTTRDCA